MTREEERVRAGLARIRRLRVMAPLATVAALVAGVNGAWFFELGYPCVPIGLSAVAIYSVLAFVHHRCPRCGHRADLGRSGPLVAAVVAAALLLIALAFALWK